MNDGSVIILGKEIMGLKTWFRDELHRELGGRKVFRSHLIRRGGRTEIVLHELDRFCGRKGDCFIVSVGAPSVDLKCLGDGVSSHSRYNSYRYNIDTVGHESNAITTEPMFIGVDYAKGRDWSA